MTHTSAATTHIRPFNATWTFPESGRSFTAIDDADYRGSIASVSARLLGSSMATQQRTIDFLLEQASSAGGVTAKPMFGEYGVYVDGKMIGSVCDDQLFVKPTELGRAHAEPVSDVPPYPSAKPQMLIAVDRWDDAKWLGELLRVTADELPTPKPRKPKRGT